MKDIARLASVSVATVSATISGKDYVSPELQERVKAAIAQLKYRPNVVASNLKKGRTSLIGLIVPDITNPFYTDLIAEFQNCARKDGLSVILGISDQDPSREIELIEFLAGQHAEALVVGSCGYNGESIGALHNVAAHLSLVLIDSFPEGVHADRIESDNFLAGQLATRQILSFGHRRIAVVTGPNGARSSDERLRGYHAAMREAGLRPSPTLQLDGGFRTEQAYETTKSLLQSRIRPTAIFVCNNLMLIGVMRAISECGLRVPEDISIVNVDDFPWASAFRPAMTTVRQPTTEIARTAYQTARSRMQGLSGEAVHRIFSPELVQRSSCAEPAAVSSPRKSQSS
jgi:LacI family transcriptional regulator